MITVVDSNELLTKEFKADGTKIGDRALKFGQTKVFDPQTPREFINILEQLTSHQCIISGVQNDSSVNEVSQKHRRTKANYHFDGAWLPFDRDYPIHTDTDYIDLLASVDPQLKYVSYVRKASASNIKLGNKLLAPHREKIWMRFKPDATLEQIDTYRRNLFKKCIIAGYGHIYMSESPKSYATYIRTIFDDSCFSPERVHYEAKPITEEPYEHNTYYYAHDLDEHFIDPTTLTISDYEENKYTQIKRELKNSLNEEVTAKRIQVQKDYPQDYGSLDAGVLTAGTTLYAIDADEKTHVVEVEDLVNAILASDVPTIKLYASYDYADPYDPDYGARKAKLFINDDSLILNSFAHGDHYLRVLADVLDIPEALEQRDIKFTVVAGRPPSRKEKARAIKVLKELLPNFYLHDNSDASMVATDLKVLGSKPEIKKVIEELSFNRHKASRQNIAKDPSLHPLNEYSFFKEKGGNLITLDKEDGIQVMSRDAAKAYCRGLDAELSGDELFDMFMDDPKRENVTGVGLYAEGTPFKKNAWSGFKATELHTSITQNDIQPFIEQLKLATGTDPQALDYHLDWLADLVQQPLRESIRTALIYKSEQFGTGKSTTAQLISSFFHSYNTFETTKIQKVAGQFNAHLMPVVFLNLDEVATDKDTQFQATVEILKNMISSEVMAMEQKGIDARMVPNRIHLLITTNKPFGYASSNDRRYTTFDFSSARKDDTAYFKKLRAWWGDEGRDKVFTYLRQREIPKEGILSNFKGEGTVRASIEQLRYYEKWLFFVLSSLNEDTRFTSNDLFVSFENFIELQGGESRMTKALITKRLKQEFTRTAMDPKNNLYAFNVEKMRQEFTATHLNVASIDWDDFSLDLDADDKLKITYTSTKNVTKEQPNLNKA